MRPEHDDRASLSALIAALDASPRASLHRETLDGRNKSDGDEPPPYAISGRSGRVYADGDGFLLYVTTGASPRRWGFVKKRLMSFCRVTQDGEDEGCLHLDRLPSPAEASLIREALGIKRKRQLSAEAKAELASRLSKNCTGGAYGDALSI